MIPNLDEEFDGRLHALPQVATKDDELVGNEADCLQSVEGFACGH